MPPRPCELTLSFTWSFPLGVMSEAYWEAYREADRIKMQHYYRSISYPFLLGPGYEPIDYSERGEVRFERGDSFYGEDMPVYMPFYFYQFQMDWSLYTLKTWWRKQLCAGTYHHRGPFRDQEVPDYV